MCLQKIQASSQSSYWTLNTSKSYGLNGTSGRFASSAQRCGIHPHDHAPLVLGVDGMYCINSVFTCGERPSEKSVGFPRLAAKAEEPNRAVAATVAFMTEENILLPKYVFVGG